jgi:hypothetical protein
MGVFIYCKVGVWGNAILDVKVYGPPANNTMLLSCFAFINSDFFRWCNHGLKKRSKTGQFSQKPEKPVQAGFTGFQ